MFRYRLRMLLILTILGPPLIWISLARRMEVAAASSVWLNVVNCIE